MKDDIELLQFVTGQIHNLKNIFCGYLCLALSARLILLWYFHYLL